MAVTHRSAQARQVQITRWDPVLGVMSAEFLPDLSRASFAKDILDRVTRASKAGCDTQSQRHSTSKPISLIAMAAEVPWQVPYSRVRGDPTMNRHGGADFRGAGAGLRNVLQLFDRIGLQPHGTPDTT